MLSLTWVAVVVVEIWSEISPLGEFGVSRISMGGMVWSAKESWYGLVTLIEVGYDPLTGVYLLGLTRIRLVPVDLRVVTVLA
jgi:hypothetical protein